MCFYNLEIYFHFSTYLTVFSYTTLFTVNNSTVFSHTTVCNNNITVRQLYENCYIIIIYCLWLNTHTSLTHTRVVGESRDIFFSSTQTQGKYFLQKRITHSIELVSTKGRTVQFRQAFKSSCGPNIRISKLRHLSLSVKYNYLLKIRVVGGLSLSLI